LVGVSSPDSPINLIFLDRRLTFLYFIGNSITAKNTTAFHLLVGRPINILWPTGLKYQ